MSEEPIIICNWCTEHDCATGADVGTEFEVVVTECPDFKPPPSEPMPKPALEQE